MQNLQSLIKDILAHSEDISVNINLESYYGQAEVSCRPSTTRNISLIAIYVDKSKDIDVYHNKHQNRTIVGFNTKLEDAGFDFNPAIEEAARLWNIYKATNL